MIIVAGAASSASILSIFRFSLLQQPANFVVGTSSSFSFWCSVTVGAGEDKVGATGPSLGDTFSRVFSPQARLDRETTLEGGAGMTPDINAGACTREPERELGGGGEGTGGGGGGGGGAWE